jgi:2-keto-3-deoxy-6-phosphogluconate aldolase
MDSAATDLFLRAERALQQSRKAVQLYRELQGERADICVGAGPVLDGEDFDVDSDEDVHK